MLSFKVPDMTCGHCVGAITAAVHALDGNARVSVDLARQVVSVESPQADAPQLREAITQAGYSPEPLPAEAPAAAAAKGCCGCGCR